MYNFLKGLQETKNNIKKNNVLDNNYFRRVYVKNPIEKINNYGSNVDLNLIQRKKQLVRNKGTNAPAKKYNKYKI